MIMMFMLLAVQAQAGIGDDFVPMQNRGALAWRNVAAGDELGMIHPEVTRLLAHAGADKTELVYLPTARKWLEGLMRQGIEYVSVDDLDRLMMREFDDLCYGQKKKYSAGSVLFNAMIGCFPEMHGRFPRARRCMTGWRKVRPPGEGGPMPIEAAYYQAKKYLEEGRIMEAWIVLVSVDCYLRSQDWSGLVGRDIVDDRRSCALMLGVSERGDETKGGPNQGVVVHRGFVADGLVAIRDLVDPDAQVFLSSPTTVRKKHAMF